MVSTGVNIVEVSALALGTLGELGEGRKEEDVWLTISCPSFLNPSTNLPSAIPLGVIESLELATVASAAGAVVAAAAALVTEAAGRLGAVSRQVDISETFNTASGCACVLDSVTGPISRSFFTAEFWSIIVGSGSVNFLLRGFGSGDRVGGVFLRGSEVAAEGAVPSWWEDAASGDICGIREIEVFSESRILVPRAEEEVNTDADVDDDVKAVAGVGVGAKGGLRLGPKPPNPRV